MPGVIAIDDNFTGLALNTTISGRVPPVTDSSAAYAVDPNAAAVNGGGSNDVRFNTGGVAKIRSNLSSGAIQVIVADNSANEVFSVYTRDTANTPHPRYGYALFIGTRHFGGVNGQITAGIINDYIFTAIAPYNVLPWTFASNGINTVALESAGNNHRIIVNNVAVGTFTNTTFPEAPTATKYSVKYNSAASPSVLRLDRLSIYDSIVVTATPAYAITSVS